MIVSKNLFPSSQAYSSIRDSQSQFESLQLQLATGKSASTLSELGSNRSYDLNLHASQGRVEGYQSTIQMVNLRLDFLDNAVSRIDQLEAEVRSSSSPGGYGSDNVNLSAGPSLANARMEELVSLLNTEADGRYLFAGSTTDAKPVEGVSALMDGSGGRDGYRTIASERIQADQGADGQGRLALATVTDTVTLSEDAVHEFGFKLSTLSSDSSDVTVTTPSGAPATLDVQFTGTASDGDAIRIGLALPDGEEHVIAMRAVEGTPSTAFEFSIGATADDTAANFEAALSGALVHVGERELAAASAMESADNFFNGVGETVQRVDGPPFNSATGFVAATEADTVSWYSGEDSTDPRKSVSVRADDAVRVNYGVQANEFGFAELMKNLAVMSGSSFSSSDDSAHDRFDYIATKQQANLADNNNGEPGSVELIALELGLARTSTNSASERHTAHNAQLETLIAQIEEAPIEEVAMQLLNIQTRLEASYQTMSTLAGLTLVNFIR